MASAHSQVPTEVPAPTTRLILAVVFIFLFILFFVSVSVLPLGILFLFRIISLAFSFFPIFLALNFDFCLRFNFFDDCTVLRLLLFEIGTNIISGFLTSGLLYLILVYFDFFL